MEEPDPVKKFMEMDLSHLNWLKNYDFRTLIDIGANQGQFAYTIRRLFPDINIYSFEPLPEVYEQLVNNFKNDKAFASFNYALGDSEETQTMYLNEFSLSSSLLLLNDEHKKHFDYAKKEIPVQIRVIPLDKVFASIEIQKPALIKIDVQGFEEHVINGGQKTILECTLIIIEVSFKNLYQDQPLFNIIYERLVQLGFKYIGNFEQLTSPIDGEILQADALFLNQNIA